MADRITSLKQKYGITDTPTAPTSAPKTRTSSLVDKYGLQDIAGTSSVANPMPNYVENDAPQTATPSAGSLRKADNEFLASQPKETQPPKKPSLLDKVESAFTFRFGTPPANIPVEKKSTIDRNLTAGFGDVASSLGSAANMAGKKDLAENLKQHGAKLQSEATADPDWEGVKSLFDPKYLSTRGVRSLAFPIAMAPATVVGAEIGTAVAGAAGLGALGTWITASLGGAIASRPAESAMEAGQTYEEAVKRGMSEEDAQRAARGVFWKNMALTVTDAGELFTTLVKLPQPVKSMLGVTTKGTTAKLLFGAAKVLGTATQEAGEEGVQEVFQRKALGDSITFDKSMQEQMGLGALMGGGMALAGSGADIKGSEKPAPPTTPTEPAKVETSTEPPKVREMTVQERADVTTRADSALRANSGDVEAAIADMNKHAQAARDDNNTKWLATWEPVIEELNRRNTSALKGEYTWSVTGEPVSVVKDDGGPQVEVESKSGRMWVKRDALGRGQSAGDVVTFGGQEYVVYGKDESGRVALAHKGQPEAQALVNPDMVTPTGRKEAVPAKAEAKADESNPAYAGTRPTLPQNAPPLEPVSRRQIVKYLDNAFAPLRVGFLSKVKGALGIFKGREGVIRTRLAEDFPVQAHEIGHKLDRDLQLSDPAFDAELIPLGTPTSPQGSTAQYVRGEGVGEFIRLYVTDPAKIAQTAPNFAAAFDARLASEPDVKAKLDGARLLMQRWTSQDPHAKLDGIISVDDKGSSRPVTYESLRSQLVEQLTPLERATKELSGGRKLTVDEDPFAQALLARGWAGKAETSLEYGIVDKDFNKVGESYKDILKDVPDVQEFRRYLVSKRAKELITKRKLSIEEVLGAGVSEGDVNKVLQDLSPQYDALSKRLVKFQDSVLQDLVDSGRISQNEAAEMRKWNEDYIPFYRFFDEKTGAFNFAGANHLVNVGNPIKAFKGSGRSIVDPLESVVKNTFSITNAATRNNVGRALLNLAQRSNNLGRLVEIVDEGAHDANIVNVYRNGEKVRLKVDPELHRSLLFLDREQTALWVKLVGLPAKTLRAGAILNPDFVASNPVVDQFTAFINSEFGYVPVLDFIRGTKEAATKSDLYWKWKAAGGAQSTFVSLDRNHLQKELNKLIDSGTLTGRVIKHANLIELLRALSEHGELGTRLGEFRKGVIQDSSREGILQAALESRDVTLDFARTGSKTKTANQISAFFNASIQGLDKTVREFQAHPARTFARATAAYTLPTIALYLLNRGNPNYEEKDEWVKDAFWLIPTDMSNPSQSKHFLWIPKKHALAMTFGALPERLLRMADKKDKKAFDVKFASRFAQAWLPSAPLPTAIMPLLENAANYSFYTDLPLVPQREQKLEAKDQYGNYTSEASKTIARAADKIGLGFSPRKLDNLVRGWGGGVGTLGADIASRGVNAVGLGDNIPKPDRGAAGFPIGRRFLRDAGGAGPGVSVDNFYNEVDKLERKYASTPKGTPEKQSQLDFLRPLRKMADDISDLRTEKRAVEASMKLTPQEKRARIDAIDLKMTNIARRAYGKEPIQ